MNPPKPPKPPLSRHTNISLNSCGVCEKCGSTIKTIGIFNRKEYCINPECKNHKIIEDIIKNIAGDKKMFFKNKQAEIHMNIGSSITINGDDYVGGDVIIDGDKVIIDGEEITKKYPTKKIDIIINGDIQSVNLENGSIKCDSINCNLKTVNGDVEADEIIGDVKTVNGDVECNTISGNVKTSNGKIKYKK